MMHSSKGTTLKNKIDAFKRKYFVNQLLRGLLITSALLLFTYLVFSTLEYTFRFSSVLRGILFFSFILLSTWSMVYWVLRPLREILSRNKSMSDEEAALRIGSHFPGVRDKLLNTLQLIRVGGDGNNLIGASIDQRTSEIQPFSFTSAINLKENSRYLKYILIPVTVFLILIMFIPQLLSEGTTRIVNYRNEFAPIAPFEFDIPQNLVAFKNEDFELRVEMNGSSVPENAYLMVHERKVKMHMESAGVFSHRFRKVQSDISFHIEAEGFRSTQGKVNVVQRPDLKGLEVQVDYPRYLRRGSSQISGAGNLILPEGSTVTWFFDLLDTDSLSLSFGDDKHKNTVYVADNQSTTYNKQIFSSSSYQITLYNEFSTNKAPIEYSMEVIKDEYPSIDVNQFQDTTMYQFIILGGNISDDYGIRDLRLFYRSPEQEWTSKTISVDRSQASQSYYYRWTLDSLLMQEGEAVEYYLQVWDNDQIHGYKSSKTGIYQFKVPERSEMSENLAEESRAAETKIDETLKKAEELNSNLEEMEEKLKEKQQLNWQDEKKIEEILKDRKELEEEIEKLKEDFNALQQKQQRFNQPSEELKDKAEQLQQLMDELLDEETRELYRELQEMLEDSLEKDQVQDLLNQINNREKDLEKELERTLELFKKLQVETKMEELVKDMKDLAQEQDSLADQTRDRNESQEELLEKQEEIERKFNEMKQEKSDVEKLNQELKQPKPIQNSEEQEQKIEEQLQDSKEQLQKNKRNPASKSQQKSAEEMKKMAEQMQNMMSSMEMQSMQLNMEQLREIVDNLIKLSKDQEGLMNEFSQVNQSDPRFIELSQDQIKLKDDAKVIEDSLLALAERVFQIQSFVTREVSEMNRNMDEAVTSIRERKQAQTVGKQQYAMTSMNNLALLLDDVLQQMQQAMSDAMGNPQQGNQEGDEISMSELQKQLNQQIEDLKKGGKQGRALSEELAKLAAEQERLRKMLQELSENSGEDGKGEEPGGNMIMEKMEETELDLANKQITRETINRQQEILTRLLEFEEAMRERELDNERKGETARDYQKQIPKEFEEYFKAKQREVELLKTVPPKLNPYYKKEVNDYFKRISNQE